MNTKRINNAHLEMTFHEKFNITKFWNLKRKCSKMICKTKICSY